MADINETIINVTLEGAIIVQQAGVGGITDGDKGDITVSSAGTQWSIDNNAVTNTKSAQMATKTYKGRTSAGTGNAEDVSVATLKTDLGLGNVDNTSDLNKPISTATQTALDGKVSDTGDIINGVFQNSTDKTTKLVLIGDATGNNSQGDPVSNSSPKLDLTTYQVSEYQFSDPDLGGYSELIRLKAGQQKAKPTLAYYDYSDKPVAWFVAHFQGQDLQRYATLANFPAVGVDDNLTGYFDISTNKYYRWDGTQYVELLPSDERYWYMAIHQHISTETADSTGSSNFTRLALQYGFDVIAVDTTNAHFRIKDGTFKNQDFGAFIIDSGKTYSKNKFDFFPSANTATQILNRNDGDLSTIFNQNTQSFRVELLPIGNANNPTATAQIAIATDNTTTRLLIPKNTILPNHNLGIGLDAGARLDVRHNLGNANNTEYTISRISRDESSGFMQFGYIGNGTDLSNFLIRMTNSKGLVIGTTSNPTGFIFANNGNLTAAGTITGSNLSGTNTGDQTFITPRVQTAASSATVTPTANDDLVVITAQAAGLTLANPTGTFVQGQSMVIRIKDNGTARSIAYGVDYRAIGVTLPTTTVINKTTYLGCIYNTTDNKLDIVGVCTEA
jgi:hypothetical protein